MDRQSNIILGNPEIEALVSGQREIPQTLLLAGPSGAGRNYFARLIAASYIGQHQSWVMEGTHPDCIVVKGKGASGQIPVKDVREALRESVKSPAAGNARVVIICDCEMLNPASANALLKSLEEPTPGLAFILTAEGASSVPATVLSRCELYAVKPVTKDICKAFVSRKMKNAEEAHIEMAISVFGGRIGSVLKCLSDPKQMDFAKKALSLKNALAAGDKTGVMSITSSLKTREEALTLVSFTMISLEQTMSPAAALLLSDAAQDLRSNMPIALCFAALSAKL